MKHISLRLRVLLVLAAVLISTFMAVTVLLVRQETASLRRSLQMQATSFAALATKPLGDTYLLYQDSGRLHITQEVNKFTDLEDSISYVAIVDSSNHILYKNIDKPVGQVPANAGSVFQLEQVHARDGALTAIVYPYLDDSGMHPFTMVYGVSNRVINQRVTDLIKALLVTGLIILIISLTGTYLLLNYLFVKPVAAITRAASAISAGAFDQQISLRRRDELGVLAQAVNKMADSLKEDIRRLQELDRLKSEFLAVTSHHLRTPLTAIEGYLSMLEVDPSSAEAMESIGYIKASVASLHVLTESMLAVASLEAGQKITFFENKPLLPLLKNLIEKVQPMATHQQLHITLQTEAEPEVRINEYMIKTAILNILDNAIKFTPKGGTVVITLKERGGQVLLSVEDTGVGIAADELPHVFTKLHRGTDYMNFNYEGVGIGLYLTKLIMNQHQGKISVKSQKGKGTTVEIMLPLAASAASS